MSHTSQNDNPHHLLDALEDSSSSEDNVEMHQIPLSTSSHLKNHESTNEDKCPDINYESDILKKIAKIKSEVEHIEQEFMSLPRDELKEKCHIYEELLFQKTIDLDNIDTKCLEEIRKSRKNVIMYIQRCLQTFEDVLNK